MKPFAHLRQALRVALQAAVYIGSAMLAATDDAWQLDVELTIGPSPTPIVHLSIRKEPGRPLRFSLRRAP